MNKVIIALVFLTIMVMAVPADDATTAVQAILSEIESQQDVDSVEQIDPDRVGDAQLAELGEALMDLMVPNERQQHDLMDEMIGGEGSQSLEAMYRSMGYSYLAGGGDAFWRPGRGSGMMGPWMMGGWPGWGGHMMSASPLVWVLVAVLTVLVVLLAVLLTARRRGSIESERPSAGPREILDRRYARGEISREEYVRVREDLQ